MVCLQGGSTGRTLTAEVLVLGREQEGVRHDVEALETVKLLHALDVLIQPVFAGQFVGPGVSRGSKAAHGGGGGL